MQVRVILVVVVSVKVRATMVKTGVKGKSTSYVVEKKAGARKRKKIV